MYYDEYVLKCNFQQSLLQSSVWHDPSENILIGWFAAEETFLIIINVINSADIYFYGSHENFCRILLSSKEQHLFKLEIFCLNALL